MSKIFYIMGKSSSGKDSFFKEIRKRIPEMKEIILYTTRPIREGETDGVEYHFVGEEELERLEKEGRVIELRAYNTVHGVWKYFTADDGQIDLEKYDYLVIGTLESYEAMRKYYGEEAVVPIYVEVEDGIRLSRALEREKEQAYPKYAELCRRFLADSEDFSEENLEKSGIMKKFRNMEFKQCADEIYSYIQVNRK
ncbi:MAG: guanylate kinase [Schaedlerella sp.]|nr:guanylate kinase [Lachnospiraceae bacterium]MDY4203146.1 guanylate kinase [Schaedlerella sp.]